MMQIAGSFFHLDTSVSDCFTFNLSVLGFENIRFMEPKLRSRIHNCYRRFDAGWI